MMNLTNIPFSLFSIESVSEFASQTLSTMNSKHSEDPLLASAIAALSEPMSQATLAIGSSQKEALTAEINLADTRRDRSFIGFRKHLEADLYCDWQDEVQQAANRLMEIVRKHGISLQEEGLTDQSAVLKSLFEDLSTEEATSDLSTTNLTGWINQLKSDQENFTNLYQQRIVIESAKNIPTKAQAQSQLVSALKLLLSGLHFLAGTQPAKYGATANLIVNTASKFVGERKTFSYESGNITEPEQ